jgi:peroxiredoxin
MKIFYSPSFVLVLMMIAGWQSPEPGFIIQGNLQGIAIGTAYITYEFNYKDHIDSAVIQDGQFTLKGQLPEPLLCTLRVSGSQQIRIFFAENTHMQVTGNVSKLFDATISGGVEQGIWNSFNIEQREVIGAKVMEVRKRPTLPVRSLGEGGKDSTSHRLSPADEAEINSVKDSVMRTFVKAHPASVAAACIIYQTYIVYPDYQRAGVLYSLLNNNIKHCYYARRIEQNVHASDKITIGVLAPGFTLPDTTGNMISLANFKGQYVLVDFWASWCMPCRKENPFLKKAYDRFHPKGFEIIGVSLDGSKAAWCKAIETDGLPWIHLSDGKGSEGPVPDSYGVKTIPKNVLLDKTGKIIARNLSGEELQKKLEEIIK